MSRIFKEKTKPLPISKSMVWQAFKKVRKNKGSAGVNFLLCNSQHCRHVRRYLLTTYTIFNRKFWYQIIILWTVVEKFKLIAS